MPVNLGDYAEPLTREPRHVHIPEGLCRVRCKGCHTVWWSPRPLDSLRSHWVIRHAEDAEVVPLHPCGRDCDDCADIWLLRLWGMDWHDISARLGRKPTFARAHANGHRLTDPAKPIRRTA